MIIDVGHAQRLHGRGSDPQQDLSADQQEVRHVGVGSVPTQLVIQLLARAVGAHVPHLVPAPHLHGVVLVLAGEELRQGGQQRPQRHHDAPAADESRPVCPSPEVADKQDKGQIPDLKTAGNHAHVSTLQVEAPL